MRRKKLAKKKLPFGGYNIRFENCPETMEQVFGKKPLTPSEMTKVLWKFIKKHRLSGYDD